MMLRFSLIALLAGTLVAAEPPSESPWAQSRDLGQFSGLLKRSPFSLPTVEESAPLAQRFSLTGAVALDGENQIFVLDKTTLKRERVSAAPGPSGLQLVEFLPDPDPRKMRATIRLGDQTATIAFTPNAAPSGAPPSAAAAENGAAKSSAPPVASAPSAPPAAAASAQVSPPPAGEDSAKKPGRIVIRRPKISGNPTPAP
jgi:hypothetical protein